MINAALLILRLMLGGLLAGHGAQKLFGWFGGYGLEGTAGWLQSLGLKPGRLWAGLAGGAEFGGGLLMLLGFLNPLGPLAAIGAMGMATAKAHWGKPIWVTSGGAELPITNIAIALALGLAGPGRFSLDQVFGTRLPRLLLIPGLLLAALGIGAGVIASRAQAQPAEEQQAAEPAPEQTATVEQPLAQQAPPAVAAAEIETSEGTGHQA